MMERRVRFIWWGFLVVLIIVAIWKLFLPHGNKAYLEKTSANREIVVYVTGAVSKPGLVHLPLDARLDDALKAAALSPEANMEVLNPAEKLKDGQKISVPYRQSTAASAVGSTAGYPVIGSLVPGATGGTGTPGAGGAAGATNANGSAGATASAAATAGTGKKININTAGVTELDQLPGIGPALAERIIQYRTDHGLFVRPEDLQEVSGIGPKTYEKMASLVSVGP